MTRSSPGTMTRPGAKRSLSEFHESESKVGFTMRVSRFPDAVEAEGGAGYACGVDISLRGLIKGD